MSDRGYSSMTLDEAGKRSSMVIGSQDSLDSINKLKILGKEERSILTNGNKRETQKRLLQGTYNFPWTRVQCMQRYND